MVIGTIDRNHAEHFDPSNNPEVLQRASSNPEARVLPDDSALRDGSPLGSSTVQTSSDRTTPRRNLLFALKTPPILRQADAEKRATGHRGEPSVPRFHLGRRSLMVVGSADGLRWLSSARSESQLGSPS